MKLLYLSSASNASQGGSDQEDTDTAEVFELNEQRASDSDHVVDAHFNTLSKANQKLQSLEQSISSPVNEKPNDGKQLELTRAIFLQLQQKLTELKNQCQELEKKKHQREFDFEFTGSKRPGTSYQIEIHLSC